MRIKSIHIEHFRSINQLTVNFEQLTALIGGNNVGKSSVLKAIEIFFEAAPRLAVEDFHKKGTD
jgi:predicted ATP-dependent endonuclease of OLD family